MTRRQTGLGWAGLLLCAIAGAGGAAASSGDPSGAELAAACAACHRADSQGSVIPSLSGSPAAQIERALHDYRAGARPSLVMHGVAAALTADESIAVARYLAAQRPPRPAP